MEKVRKIVVNILKNLVQKKYHRSITADSRLREDLGLNSMMLVTLVMELQKQTTFDITRVDGDDDLKAVSTVQDVADLVYRQTGGAV